MKKSDEDYPYFVRYEGSAGRIDKGHYHLQLVMKLYKCSLLDIVKDPNSMYQQKKIKYAKGAARGLRFLHKHQVMHRDVKLSNYLVSLILCSLI
jgi:serine/threonine protein kinase